MNISIIRLKGVVKELSMIRRQLTRIADAMDDDLVQKGVRDPQPQKSDPDSSIEYVDEEMDWGRENIPNFDALMAKQEKDVQ